jgi:hypothetical protein
LLETKESTGVKTYPFGRIFPSKFPKGAFNGLSDHPATQDNLEIRNDFASVISRQYARSSVSLRPAVSSTTGMIGTAGDIKRSQLLVLQDQGPPVADAIRVVEVVQCHSDEATAIS